MNSLNLCNLSSLLNNYRIDKMGLRQEKIPIIFANMLFKKKNYLKTLNVSFLFGDLSLKIRDTFPFKSTLAYEKRI